MINGLAMESECWREVRGSCDACREESEREFPSCKRGDSHWLKFCLPGQAGRPHSLLCYKTSSRMHYNIDIEMYLARP